MPKSSLLYLRLSDLAYQARLHPHAVERMLFRGVLVADAQVQHGRTAQPIFLEARLKKHLEVINRYRRSEKAAQV